ncbi:MAG: hypothetical protein WBV69_11475, partial [Candidatus Sulfotelmatobacter sp.]
MRTSVDPGLVKRLSFYASAASVFSVMVGLLVLAGWTFHIMGLITWGGATPMAPNAAISLTLAGASLWLLRNNGAQSRDALSQLAGKIAAAMVTLIGSITLAEHLFSWDLHIDRLLVVTPPTPGVAAARVLMSPVAALIFLLLGPALLTIDWRTRRGDWPSQFLSLGAMMASAFGLLGLILGPSVTPITLALPAELSYLLITSGIVASRPDWALGGLLVSQNSGARLFRRGVPAALLVLGAVGFILSKFLLTEAHLTWVEVSAIAVASGIALAGFTAWMAFAVERGAVE